MDCIEAQGLINQFIDDKMDEKTLTEFLEHVKRCPSCYDDLEATYAVMAVIRLLDDEEETPELLRPLDHRIEEKEIWLKQQRRNRFFKKACGLTAFLVTVFLVSSIVMFLAGDIHTEVQLTVPFHARLNNPMNIHRTDSVIDNFLYIRQGDKIYIVSSKKMPGIFMFDSRRADRSKEGWIGQ